MLKKLWWYLRGLCPLCGSELEMWPDDFADWTLDCSNDDCNYSRSK